MGHTNKMMMHNDLIHSHQEQSLIEGEYAPLTFFSVHKLLYLYLYLYNTCNSNLMIM